MTTDTKPAGGEKKAKLSGSHDGTVTAMDGHNMTTRCTKGDSHDLTIAKDAKVTCDGKAATPADVKVGANVRVTAHKDNETVATAVACTSAKPAAKKAM